jgi:hypothetical protein
MWVQAPAGADPPAFGGYPAPVGAVTAASPGGRVRVVAVTDAPSASPTPACARRSQRLARADPNARTRQSQRSHAHVRARTTAHPPQSISSEAWRRFCIAPRHCRAARASDRGRGPRASGGSRRERQAERSVPRRTSDGGLQRPERPPTGPPTEPNITPARDSATPPDQTAPTNSPASNTAPAYTPATPPRAGSARRCASPAGWSCPRTPPRRPD